MNSIRKSIIFLLAIFAVSILHPAGASAVNKYSVKKLKSRKNGAVYLVVAPKAFHDELQPLLDHRAAGGMSVALVSPKDIYTEFDRRPPGPWPIKEFVTFAAHNWKKGTPKYLLLVGDINVFEQYDPNGLMMPTFIVKLEDEDEEDGEKLAASDTAFGDVDGDEVPDIAVGRIPADNKEEVAAAVRKILNYETNPTPGPWRRRASVLASTGNFGIFDTTLEETTKKLVRSNFDPVFDLNMTYGGSSMPYFQMPADFKQKVFDRFSDGSLFMTYIGHGSVTGLSSVCYKGKCKRIMQNEDVGGIKTGGKPPFFFSICCLTGKFDIQEDSIAEEMFKAADGPIGVFAATEVSHPYSNTMLSKDIMYYMMDKRPATIGEGILNIYRSLVWRFDTDRKFIDKQYALLGMGRKEQIKNSYDHIYLYNYIGDPATKIPYAAETIEIDAPTKAGPGEKLHVAIRTKEKKKGKLLFTFESHPTEIIYDITDIDGLAGNKLSDAVTSNYQNANNKIAYRMETELDDTGAALVDFTVPAFIPSGKYFLKAYAWDGTTDAMGISEIDISNPDVDAQRAKTEAAAEQRKKEKKVVTFKDRLADIIAGLTEPELKVNAYLYATNDDGTAATPEKKNRKWKDEEKRRKATDRKTVAAMIRIAENNSSTKNTFRALKRAETMNPTSDELQDIADIYEKIFRLADARAALTKAVLKDGDNIRSMRKLAHITSRLGDNEKAVELLDNLIDRNADDFDSLWMKAKILEKMNLDDDAEETYLKAEKLADDYSTIHRDIFNFYQKSIFDYEKSEKKAREIVEKQKAPYWRDLTYPLAWLVLKKDRSNIKEAAELMWLYYKAEDNKHAEAMALAKTGAAFYSFFGDRMKSRTFLDAALEMDPKCYECATIKLNIFDNSEREKRCKKAVEINPDYTEGYLCLADVDLDRKLYDDAITYYRKAHETEPGMTPRIKEVVAYYKAGRSDKANELIKKIKGAPHPPDNSREAAALISRMSVFNRTEDYDSLHDEYRRYVKRWPYSWYIHHFMAGLCAGRDEYELAAKYEKSAIENNQFCEDCYLALGRYSIEIEQYADAENVLRKGVLIAPENVYMRAELGRTLALKGEKREARELLMKIVQNRRYYYLAMKGLEELIDPNFFLN